MYPWSRQKGENTKQYDAFLTFLDMGTHRSKTLTAERSKISLRQIHNYAKKHDWNRRAQEFDHYRLDKRRRLMQIFIEKNAERRGEIARDLADSINGFLEKLYVKFESEKNNIEEKNLDQLLKIGQGIAKTMPDLMKAVDSLGKVQKLGKAPGEDKLEEIIRNDEVAMKHSQDLLSRISELRTVNNIGSTFFE
jgi:hypothetical protein